MRASAVSFAHKLTAATLAALLSFTLVPFAHADGESSGAEGAFSSGGSEAKQVPLGATSPQPPSGPSTEASDPSITLSGAAEGGEGEGSNSKPLTLASGLAGKPGNFINSDVALDGEPIIGSFTVDGLTYAVIDESTIELVGVAPSVILSEGSEAAGVEESDSNHASEAGLANLALPETVSYENATYTLTSIAPYAFYLSGVTSVTLPASVNDVDDRAFRSSDVAIVTVAEGNPTYSSFDGALYDADQLSLLLIPEGKQGTVRIPKTAEIAEASVFSHCPLVESISVDAGSAAFASEDGLLYTSDLTTLLHVPAGATEITIREGCTTIAVGALEACAKLTTINAPATVTSISPDIFESVPTVSLPAQLALHDETTWGPGPIGIQITALVSLSSANVDFLKVDPSSIEISLPKEVDAALWQRAGFSIKADSTDDVSSFGAELRQDILNYGATTSVHLDAGGGLLRVARCRNFSISGGVESGDWEVIAGGAPEWNIAYDLSQSTEFNGQVTFGAGWWLKEGDVFVLYRCETLPRTGYALAGISGSANLSVPIRNQAFVPGGAYRILWRAHTYSIHFNSQGGNAIGTWNASYDQDVTLPEPTRLGYVFMGWDTQADGKGVRYAPGEAVRNLTFEDNGLVELYAQWDATISAIVPFDVEAKVDVLGLEAPKEAQGYIESRCGEALKVAEVKLTPLDGAKELFGASNVADVFLEVLANGSASPNARFSLGALATESDASKLQALTMGSYGAKVPISYRFVMPPEVQTSLVEYADPQPVCSVAYTVALV